MNFVLAKKLVAFAGENSPIILTALGVTGTVTTAYLTGKASYKAYEEIAATELARTEFHKDGDVIEPDLSIAEKVRVVWPLYIPPIVAGTMTIASIIMANRISSTRAAAFAAAAGISERALQDYKEKVVEKLGQTKATNMHDAIAQDRVNAHPIGSKEIILAGTGEVLCFDMYSGRYFQSTVEEIKKAENALNFNIVNNMSASLSEFYQDIGLPPNGASEYVGWSSDQMVDVTISAVMSPDGRPCMAIDFSPSPSPNYQKLY